MPKGVEEQTQMTFRDSEKLNKPMGYRKACYDSVTYKEAMTGSNADDWKTAMDNEMLLQKNETWKLVDFPVNKKTNK